MDRATYIQKLAEILVYAVIVGAGWYLGSLIRKRRENRKKTLGNKVKP